MFKEIFFSICMMMPGACEIENNIDIRPYKVNSGDYEVEVKKSGVLKKEEQGET